MITLSRDGRSENRRVSSEFDVLAEFFEFSAFRFSSFYTRVRGASKTNYSIIHCGDYARFLDGIFPRWHVKSTIIIFRLNSFQKLHYITSQHGYCNMYICCLLLACYYMIILCHRVIPQVIFIFFIYSVAKETEENMSLVVIQYTQVRILLLLYRWPSIFL